MLNRPTHLAKRQTIGRAFSEDVTLIRYPAGSRVRGEWVAGVPTETTIKCSTAPPDAGSAYARTLMEQDLVRPDAIRVFYVNQEIQLGADPDVFVWKGDRYRAKIIRDWGEQFAVYGVLENPQ